jgi:2-polyprenyl-6-methoxyphenol hydroxylase-like FAD-dependent oxidoreductase
MKASETPVLIVGGGPVGLALAAELGWRGVPCTLIEQSDGRITTPKMNEVNTRTMEFCRRWGIADRVMRCPFPVDHPSQVDRESYFRRAVGRSLDVDWVGVSIWTRRGVVAERYSDGPVYLLGDAVHQLSPTGALGMNTGIGDAVDLGWKLAALYEGWGGGDLLASYDAERRPVGARNVSMTTGFFQSHDSFAHPMESIEDATPDGVAFRKELGEKLVRDVARMFRTLGLELGYRYDPSPICVPDDSP